MKLNTGDVFKLPQGTRVGVQATEDDSGYTGKKFLSRETWYIVTEVHRSDTDRRAKIVTASELQSGEYSERAQTIQFTQGGDGPSAINMVFATESRKRVISFVKEKK